MARLPNLEIPSRPIDEDNIASPAVYVLESQVQIQVVDENIPIPPPLTISKKTTRLAKLSSESFHRILWARRRSALLTSRYNTYLTWKHRRQTSTSSTASDSDEDILVAYNYGMRHRPDADPVAEMEKFFSRAPGVSAGLERYLKSVGLGSYLASAATSKTASTAPEKVDLASSQQSPGVSKSPAAIRPRSNVTVSTPDPRPQAATAATDPDPRPGAPVPDPPQPPSPLWIPEDDEGSMTELDPELWKEYMAFRKEDIA